jgi:endopolyphosphatase
VLFSIDVPSNLRSIALTIDDFPNLNDLSISFHLLDILRLYNARCTFFTIGSHIENYENSSRIRILFERLIADGHELGNHGWRDEQAIRLSEKELEKQIIDTQEIIHNYTSLNNKWFRPGSGFFNRTMIQLCTKLGYRIVLGSIYPHDPQISLPKLNSFFIEHKLYPGAIVILHDRLATIETLQRLLPAIQKRNFQVVTLTQLMDLHM